MSWLHTLEHVKRELKAEREQSAALRERLAACVEAMHRAENDGCCDYIDASKDGGAWWHDALANAVETLRCP